MKEPTLLNMSNRYYVISSAIHRRLTKIEASLEKKEELIKEYEQQVAMFDSNIAIYSQTLQAQLDELRKLDITYSRGMVLMDATRMNFKQIDEFKQKKKKCTDEHEQQVAILDSNIAIHREILKKQIDELPYL